MDASVRPEAVSALPEYHWQRAASTLEEIQRHIPLVLHEVPTGVPVLDWEVPVEWNATVGRIETLAGRTVAILPTATCTWSVTAHRLTRSCPAPSSQHACTRCLTSRIWSVPHRLLRRDLGLLPGRPGLEEHAGSRLSRAHRKQPAARLTDLRRVRDFRQRSGRGANLGALLSSRPRKRQSVRHRRGDGDCAAAIEARQQADLSTAVHTGHDRLSNLARAQRRRPAEHQAWPGPVLCRRQGGVYLQAEPSREHHD